MREIDIRYCDQVQLDLSCAKTKNKIRLDLFLHRDGYAVVCFKPDATSCMRSMLETYYDSFGEEIPGEIIEWIRDHCSKKDAEKTVEFGRPDSKIGMLQLRVNRYGYAHLYFSDGAKAKIFLHQFVVKNAGYSIEFVYEHFRETFRKSLGPLSSSSTRVTMDRTRGRLLATLNTELGGYKCVKKKCCFFNMPPSRLSDLRQILSDIDKITRGKKVLTYGDCVSIVKILLRGRDKVVADHQRGSCLARMGITDSRLATRLNRCIKFMVKNAFVEAEDAKSANTAMDERASVPLLK